MEKKTRWDVGRPYPAYRSLSNALQWQRPVELKPGGDGFCTDTGSANLPIVFSGKRRTQLRRADQTSEELSLPTTCSVRPPTAQRGFGKSGSEKAGSNLKTLSSIRRGG